jgi:hypothetical protein
MAWHLLLHELRWIRLVALFDRITPLRLVDRSQPSGMAESQALSNLQSEQNIFGDISSKRAAYHLSNGEQLFVLR